VNPSVIHGVIWEARAISREAGHRGVLPEGSQALLYLRDIVDAFLEETYKSESVRSMSPEQVRLLNQLGVAVGR
jgi:hypothetical protein